MKIERKTFLEWIDDYCAGSLDAAQREAVERWLEEHPEDRLEVQRQEGLRRAFVELPATKAPQDLRTTVLAALKAGQIDQHASEPVVEEPAVIPVAGGAERPPRRWWSLFGRRPLVVRLVQVAALVTVCVGAWQLARQARQEAEQPADAGTYGRMQTEVSSPRATSAAGGDARLKDLKNQPADRAAGNVVAEESLPMPPGPEGRLGAARLGVESQPRSSMPKRDVNRTVDEPGKPASQEKIPVDVDAVARRISAPPPPVPAQEAVPETKEMPQKGIARLESLEGRRDQEEAPAERRVDAFRKGEVAQPAPSAGPASAAAPGIPASPETAGAYFATQKRISEGMAEHSLSDVSDAAASPAAGTAPSSSGSGLPIEQPPLPIAQTQGGLGLAYPLAPEVPTGTEVADKAAKAGVAVNMDLDWLQGAIRTRGGQIRETVPGELPVVRASLPTKEAFNEVLADARTRGWQVESPVESESGARGFVVGLGRAEAMGTRGTSANTGSLAFGRTAEFQAPPPASSGSERYQISGFAAGAKAKQAVGREQSAKEPVFVGDAVHPPKASPVAAGGREADRKRAGTYAFRADEGVSPVLSIRYPSLGGKASVPGSAPTSPPAERVVGFGLVSATPTPPVPDGPVLRRIVLEVNLDR